MEYAPYAKDLTSILELIPEKHRPRSGLFPFKEFIAQIVKSLMLYYHASLSRTPGFWM
jgi:hypothetical protein